MWENILADSINVCFLFCFLVGGGCHSFFSETTAFNLDYLGIAI